MGRGDNFRSVKVQVLIGSLMVEDPLGKKYQNQTKTYSKGDIFYCPLWRAKKFSQTSVKILDEEETITDPKAGIGDDKFDKLPSSTYLIEGDKPLDVKTVQKTTLLTPVLALISGCRPTIIGVKSSVLKIKEKLLK